jgi:hypothetical protein
MTLRAGFFPTTDFGGGSPRVWANYACSSCGGMVLAYAEGRDNNNSGGVSEIIPAPTEVNAVIPEPARRYLTQAQDALHAPDGAVMLAASAVDAMLKAKNYAEGSLYRRIDQSAADNVITADMALWAHHVRLEANDARHADTENPHATAEEAKQSVEFAAALGHFLFVLPSRVRRGLEAAGVAGVDG